MNGFTLKTISELKDEMDELYIDYNNINYMPC